MANPMMRATSRLLEDLKLLKDIRTTKGKTGTYASLVQDLVSAELRKTHANTKSGYLPVGTVVFGPNDRLLVIKDVVNGTVVFNDGTFVLNGGEACFDLLWLAASIADYAGGSQSV